MQATSYIYRAGQVPFTTDEQGDRRAFNIYSPAGNIIAARQYCSSSNHQGGHVTYLADIRGSITSIVDDNMNFIQGYRHRLWHYYKNRYTDYGITTRIGEGVFNEFAYTQGIWDEATGLYYLNARFYNPVDGRFLTQDPYRGSNDQPDTWHLYGYCAGDPINWIDPTGYRRRTLAVPLIGQARDLWCVAASLQMVLRFLRPGNTRSQANLQYDMVGHKRNERVSTNAFRRGARGNNLNARRRHMPLGWREVRNQIDAGRPVVARLRWGRVGSLRGGHFAIIRGYDAIRGRQNLFINDPYPVSSGRRWIVDHTDYIDRTYGRNGGSRGVWTDSFDRVRRR